MILRMHSLHEGWTNLSHGVMDSSTVKRTMFTNSTPVKSPLHVVGSLYLNAASDLLLL